VASQRAAPHRLEALFPFLVAIAAVAALSAGAFATVPEDVPAWALHSALVYRLEVGGAVFLVLYVMVVSFNLAQHGRGFTKLSAGSVSLEAEQVAAAAGSNVEAIDQTRMAVADVTGALAVALSEVEGLREEFRGLDARHKNLAGTMGLTGEASDTAIIRNLTREVRVIHDRIDHLQRRLDTPEVSGEQSDG
jgi:hypothetical protein